jgi:hypothetical protein
MIKIRRLLAVDMDAEEQEEYLGYLHLFDQLAAAHLLPEMELALAVECYMALTRRPQCEHAAWRKSGVYT